MKNITLHDRPMLVKVFVIWFTGFAVLFGLSAISSAQRLQNCGCTCWYHGPGGKVSSVKASFTSDRSCNLSNSQTYNCQDPSGSVYKGELKTCKNMPLTIAPQPNVSPPSLGGVKRPGVSTQQPGKQ